MENVAIEDLRRLAERLTGMLVELRGLKGEAAETLFAHHRRWLCEPEKEEISKSGSGSGC